MMKMEQEGYKSPENRSVYSSEICGDFTGEDGDEDGDEDEDGTRGIQKSRKYISLLLRDICGGTTRRLSKSRLTREELKEIQLILEIEVFFLCSEFKTPS